MIPYYVLGCLLNLIILLFTFNGSPYLINRTPNHFTSILSDLQWQWDSCICLMGFVFDFKGCLLKDFIWFNIDSYSF